MPCFDRCIDRIKRKCLWHLNAAHSYLLEFENHTKTELEQLTTLYTICAPEQEESRTTSRTLLKNGIRTGHLLCVAVLWETLEREVSGPYTPPAFLHVTWSIRPICKVFSGSLPITFFPWCQLYVNVAIFTQKTHALIIRVKNR